MGFSTDAIHAGQAPDAVTGAVSVPIYQTSTYAQSGLGENTGYEYARTRNLTRERLETNLAVLEKGTHGICFASGMAAVHALTQCLRAGEHVLLGDNLYGGTYRLLDRVVGPLGMPFDTVATQDLPEVERRIRPETRMILIETPTNPVMTLTDLPRLGELCRSRGVTLAVDNTFMTPYFQNPLELGAHVVVHSTTKYLNGHSDMVGGAVITRDDALAERLRFVQNASGAVPGPFDCWLALRGVKTLALRMERHQANALEVARHLQARGLPTLYPGLPSHPQHELARTQMRGFGGMVTVELGSLEAARRVLPRFRLFTLAESLGGVESLVSHPVTMTHAAVPAERRERAGLTEGMIRLSVGCEDVEDLIRDIDQALF
jgi:cystathionine beta-lyase/cystathionine gamma-synthase